MLKSIPQIVLGQLRRTPRALVGMVYVYGVCAIIAHLFLHDTTLELRERILNGGIDYQAALFRNLLSLKGLYPVICIFVLTGTYVMFRAERSASFRTRLMVNPAVLFRDVLLIYALAFASMTAFGQTRYGEPLFEGFFIAGIAFMFMVSLIMSTGGSATETPREGLFSLLWLLVFVSVGQLLPNFITGESTFAGSFYILVDAGIVFVYASFGALLTSKGRGTLLVGKGGGDPTTMKLLGASVSVWFVGVMMCIASYLIGMLFLLIVAVVLVIVVGGGILFEVFSNFERDYGRIFQQIAQLQEQEGEGWLEVLSPFVFVAGYMESIVIQTLRGNPTELLTIGFMLWATAELIREFDKLYGGGPIKTQKVGLDRLKQDVDATQADLEQTKKRIEELYDKIGLDPAEEAAKFDALDGQTDTNSTTNEEQPGDEPPNLEDPFGRKNK